MSGGRSCLIYRWRRVSGVDAGIARSWKVWELTSGDWVWRRRDHRRSGAGINTAGRGCWDGARVGPVQGSWSPPRYLETGGLGVRG